jgi:SpoVK/Ycf46/Vps4 family AAA+-type ATPase
VEHLSEILKILDGALKANASMAANYAGLLADKLEESGDKSQARMIRERLARAPIALASAQDASRGISFGSLPVDGESRLHTVDVSQPQQMELSLVLPSAIQSRVNEFLSSVKHHDALVRAGAALPSRVLVYGPPGTGKTQLARWISAELQMPLLTVRCDTLVSSLLGQTSRNLRRVFEYAQQSPCVLFLDEFDALAGARGNDRDVGELQRVVIALLQNIDALPDSTILLAATNHDQLLDTAVWRRFSFRIPMPMPDEAMRGRLWSQLLGEFAPKGLDWVALALRSEGASGALIEQVSLDAKRTAVLTGLPTIDEDELFRRLGLTLALSRREVLSTDEAEVRWLRRWDHKRFSLRTLARLYNTSLRTITNITKKDALDEKKEKSKVKRGTTYGSTSAAS